MTHRDQSNFCFYVSDSTSAPDCAPDLHGPRAIRSGSRPTVVPSPKEMTGRRPCGLALTAIVTPAILAAVVGLWPSSAASQTTDAPQAIAVCAQNFTAPTELACGTGSNTVAAGGGTTAIGVNAHANTINATALGHASIANGDGSTSVGVIANTTGSWSTAIGNASMAAGTSATAVGDASKATANFSSAFGEHSTAGGPNSTAVGGNSTANFANSMALGAGVSATTANQIAVGTAANIYWLPGVTSAASSTSQTGVVSVVTTDPTGHLAAIPVTSLPGGAPAWLLGGNTIGAADFIGTNNAMPFVVKTNAVEHMRLTAAGDLGVGTNTPTARAEIAHGDLAPNAVALRVSNTNPTGTGFTESAIGFNVALGGTGPNPDYFAARIYSKYDGTWAADGRITMQVRDPNAVFVDVLSLKHNGPAGLVGINTITPLNPLHVDGTVRLGLAGPATTTLCYAGTSASAVIASCGPSDARLKKNVLPLANALDKLEHVRGVSFEWNDRYRSLGGSSERREIGVLAQEVEQVFPELVSLTDGDYKRVDYDRLTAVLIEAVKELRKQNDTLKRRTEALERAMAKPQKAVRLQRSGAGD
jgi:hypothetical protein